MADQKNGKGFSGFDDLVSDISKDLEQASENSATSQSNPNQNLEQSSSQERCFPESSSPEKRSNETTTTADPCTDPIVSASQYGLTHRWLTGAFIVGIFVIFISANSSKRDATSSSPAPAPPRVATSYSPAPAPPRMDLTRNEIMPQIGTNNVLSRDEIRYCLSEKIRIGAMKETVDRYSETEIDFFNITVQRYNNRCAQFRYRRGSLENVRSEVEAARGQLELEGMSRVYDLR